MAKGPLAVLLALVVAGCGLETTGILPGDAAPGPGKDAGAVGRDGPTADTTCGVRCSEAGQDAGRDAAADAGRHDGRTEEVGVDVDTDDAPADAGTDAKPDGKADAKSDAAGADVDAGCSPGPATCGAEAFCVAGSCEGARRVFVTSATYAGDFGGVTSADAICASIVSTAGLLGTWKAWVSDASTNDPVLNFTFASVPYRLLDGTVVAANGTAFVSTSSTPLVHVIDHDESAAPVPGHNPVWTATSSAGDFSGASSSCMRFTTASSSSMAAIGFTDTAGASWTFNSTESCDGMKHLYCFEQ